MGCRHGRSVLIRCIRVVPRYREVMDRSVILSSGHHGSEGFFLKKCSGKSCSLENQKRGPVSDSDGVTGARRHIGALLWNMPVDRTSEAVEKNPTAPGGQGGLPPLGCLPLWGREGVTLVISTPDKKNPEGFHHS
jgi:hypothetical protein